GDAEVAEDALAAEVVDPEPAGPGAAAAEVDLFFAEHRRPSPAPFYQAGRDRLRSAVRGRRPELLQPPAVFLQVPSHMLRSRADGVIASVIGDDGDDVVPDAGFDPSGLVPRPRSAGRVIRCRVTHDGLSLGRRSKTRCVTSSRSISRVTKYLPATGNRQFATFMAYRTTVNRLGKSMTLVCR